MRPIEAATPLRLDRLTGDDLPAAQRLSEIFGWPHRVDDWRMMLRLGVGIAARDPIGSLVGSAVAWQWDERASTVGLIIVRPDLHGQGIGQQLMARLRDTVGGKPMRLYATQEGKRLYKRNGFVQSGRVEQIQGEIAPPKPSGEARRAGPSDYAAIVDLDAVAFGVRREQMLALLLDRGDTRVSGPKDAPVGFAVRRRFGRGNLIGPVVAPDWQTARDLITASIIPGFNRVDVTPPAAPLLPYLYGMGFATAGIAEEMTTGPWPERDASTMFALASQSFG